MLSTRKTWWPGDRTIDSFADNVITRALSGGGAVLDCGFFDQVSDPDFSHHGGITGCAAWIRRNAAGQDVRQKSNGPKLYPPYSCLTGYDLYYRLMPHWSIKERMLNIGMDPGAQRLEARENGFSRWDTTGDWLTSVHQRRHLEFFFPLLVEEQKIRVRDGEVSPEDAGDEIVQAILDDLDGGLRGGLTEAGLERLRDRVREISFEPDTSTPSP